VHGALREVEALGERLRNPAPRRAAGGRGVPGKKTLARGPAQGRLGDAAFQQEETLARGPAQGRLGDAAFQEKKCLARGPAQGRLEDVAFQLRIPQRKPWQAMADNVAAAAAVVGQRDRALFGVPAEQQPAAERLAADIAGGLRSVSAAIDARRAGACPGGLCVCVCMQIAMARD